MIRMVALHWLIASLYLFGVQDMFNASDNLAEHFEFLDQQPKIFPGEAIDACWCSTGIRHGCIEHDGNLSDKEMPKKKLLVFVVECRYFRWSSSRACCLWAGIICIPNPTRAEALLWTVTFCDENGLVQQHGDPIKHVEVHAWSMHGMQWMYAWVLDL